MSATFDDDGDENNDDDGDDCDDDDDDEDDDKDVVPPPQRSGGKAHVRDTFKSCSFAMREFCATHLGAEEHMIEFFTTCIICSLCNTVHCANPLHVLKVTFCAERWSFTDNLRKVLSWQTITPPLHQIFENSH